MLITKWWTLRKEVGPQNPGWLIVTFGIGSISPSSPVGSLKNGMFAREIPMISHLYRIRSQLSDLFVWFWCWNFHFGVFGWWNSHAFDAEAIGFQSWAVLAICRNSKPTVPLLVWHTWELRPCFLSSKCQFGKTPFRWFIYQKTTWNLLFWGIPYFLTNPFQIPNC